MYKNSLVDSQKGNVGEDFQVGTFNVDAIAKSSYFRAIKLGVNTDGSVDTCIVDVRKLTKAELLNPSKHYDSIIEKAIKKYQMKVYKDPKSGFNNLSDPRYFSSEQRALTTSDAKDFLENDPAGIKHVNKRIYDHRSDVAEAGKYAKETLTDHMEHNGISAKSATNARYEEMAKGSSGKKEYNPADDDVSVANAVSIDLMVKQALRGGATAAAITFILQLAPEIVKAIDYLVKNGELDWEQIQQFGINALTASAKSFVRGSIASGIVFVAKKGFFGQAAANMDATVIGALVSIVLDTIINSVKLAAGKITAKQMGIAFIDSTVLAAVMVASSKLGGVIAQAIAPELPGIAFLIGTLIGCSLGVLYNIGKNILISFCRDSGFTCFGLVDQDYTVPEELLKDMGVEIAQIEKAPIERSSVDLLGCRNQVGRTQIDTVSYKMVKRGIIGVNKIGYVI